ncbi:MAG: hypothetical protein WBC22_00775 [Sedimentisphaerales bacterium]
MNRFNLKLALLVIFVVLCIESGTKFFAEIKERDQLQLQQIEKYEKERYRQCKLAFPIDYEERCNE